MAAILLLNIHIMYAYLRYGFDVRHAHLWDKDYVFSGLQHGGFYTQQPMTINL